MKKMIALFVAALAAMLPLSAQTCCDGKFYVAGFGGANFLQSIKETVIDSDGKSVKACIHARTGYFAGAAVGYKLNNMRLEVEFSTHQNTFNGIGIFRHFDVASYGYLVNAYYDFDFCNWGGIKPYVGAGMGYAHNTFDQCIQTQFRGHCKLQGDQFAWQLIAGVAYPLTDCVDVALEYRYFNAGNSKIHHGQLHHHDVGAALRYWF
jgi:opacity protein-like surface antigen